MSSKWYFFDVGVVSSLQGRLVRPRTPEFGPAFETYILHELLCHRDYAGGADVSHWKSPSNLEVDFILGDHTAVEVKGKSDVTDRDLRGLRALVDEKLLKRHVCVTPAPPRRRIGPIEVIPYGEFLDGLWDGEFA